MFSRLSRGMTYYKAAITGLPLGGGKIRYHPGDSKKAKTADLMKAMGRAVETFGGRYIVAEDAIGTAVEDMNNYPHPDEACRGRFA